jgi:N-methylhydantoinase A/oxoprolinase/acetone carboxylase beta subunit
VGLRARVLNPRSKLEIKPATDVADDADGPALKGYREVYFEAAGGMMETAIYDRYRLPKGESIQGPAIIEERETSIVTGPDTKFHVDAAANIIIDFNAPGEG